MGYQQSPGVVTREIDLSGVVTGVATTGGVLAGPATWGPANQKVLLDSEVTQVNTFGKPTNDTADVFFTGSSFLGYGNNLTFVRTISTKARNAVVKGDAIGTVGLTTPGAGYVHAPTLAFSGGGGTGAAATAVTDGSHIVEVIITNGGTGYTSAPTITVTATGGDTISIVAVLTPVVGVVIKNQDDYENNYAAGQVTTLGEFAAKFAGAYGNNLEIAMCDDSTQFATWTYKKFFTAPPGTSNYAARFGGSNDEIHIVVIDDTGVITGTPGDVVEKFQGLSKAVDAVDASGSSIYYPNVLDRKSNLIRWMNFVSPIPAVAASKTLLSGTSGITYTAVTPGTAGNGITVAYVDPGANNAALSVSVSSLAITVHLATGSGGAITSTATLVKAAVDGNGPASALVSTALVSSGAGVVTAVATTNLVGGLATIVNNWGVAASGVTFVKLQAPYLEVLVGGVDGNDTLTDADIINGYDQFLAEDFDFALLMTAAHSSDVVTYCINSISEFRTDNMTFVSPPKIAVVNNLGSEVTDVINYRNLLPDSSYGSMDANWIKKYDRYNDVFRYVPANGDIAGLCVRTDDTRDPWFSPAGLNRGQIKNVSGLAWNPRQAFRDELYTAGVNPIVQFPGQGTLLYGDKTMQSKPSAFDRINVRRLFIVLRKAIAKAAKYILFEFNDDITRGQFRSLIDPFLRDVQGRRGIYAYSIVCDTTNNTPQLIDTNGFQGDIYIQPAKSINFITLNFIATRTGISFDEVIGKF